MERIEYTLMAELESDFWWYRALHAVIAQRLDDLTLPREASILDAGCGTGGLLQHLLQTQTNQHYALTGLEWDATAAAIARQKTGLAISRGNINAMPYADNTFQAILSQDVLYHANVDEQAALREFHRCLAAGGHLLLSLPAYSWMRSAHDEHVHGARRYTAGRCRQLLAQHGFTVRHVGYWNSLLFPLMALQRLTVGKLKQESDVHALPAWQNRVFFAVLDLERRLRLQLPFGGSVWAWGIKT